MRLSPNTLQQIIGHHVAHFSGTGHKRALGRLEVESGAALFAVRDGLLEDPVPVTLRDVSAETVGITTPLAMMPSAGLVIRIPLADGDVLAIHCRVTRCTPLPDGHFVLGAQFLEPVDAEALERQQIVPHTHLA